MYLTACGALLGASFLLNLHDRRMLALTLLVGVSIFIPVPRHDADVFYTFCIAFEMGVAFVALLLNARASVVVAELCALLAITHLMGYALDGNPPLSPYRVIVKLLEISQLTACVALSPSLVDILRNRDATTT